MTYKITYTNTTVKASYASFLSYNNIVIDEENKTITNAEGETLPYIEITEQVHRENIGKIMRVVDGVYKEYVRPNSELLEDAKNSKIAEIKIKKSEKLYLPIEFNGSIFINSEISANALKIMKDETDEPIEWLDINNIPINLTTLQASELLELIIFHRKNIYFQESDKLNAVTNALNLQEVMVIDTNFNTNQIKSGTPLIRAADANTGAEILKMATNIIGGVVNANKEFVNSNPISQEEIVDKPAIETKANSFSFIDKILQRKHDRT